MKNYHFERDLERKIEKIKRDIEVCMLYAATQNVSDVAKYLGMGRNTVSKIINERISVIDGQMNFNINLAEEMPKIKHE